VDGLKVPPIHQSTNPSIHQSTNPPIHQSTNPPIHQSTNPSIHQSINPSIHQSINPLPQIWPPLTHSNGATDRENKAKQQDIKQNNETK
jgi:hypothetical protein